MNKVPIFNIGILILLLGHFETGKNPYSSLMTEPKCFFHLWVINLSEKRILQNQLGWS